MLVEGLSDALVPSVGELCSDPIASLLFLSLVFPLSTLFLRFRISPHYGLCNSITRIVLDLCWLFLHLSTTSIIKSGALIIEIAPKSLASLYFTVLLRCFLCHAHAIVLVVLPCLLSPKFIVHRLPFRFFVLAWGSHCICWCGQCCRTNQCPTCVGEWEACPVQPLLRWSHGWGRLCSRHGAHRRGCGLSCRSSYAWSAYTVLLVCVAPVAFRLAHTFICSILSLTL